MNYLDYFGLLYGLSMIPWLLSFYYKEREIQSKLLIVDAALTIMAMIYLTEVIDLWIMLFIPFNFYVVPRIIRRIGLIPYSAMVVKE